MNDSDIVHVVGDIFHVSRPFFSPHADIQTSFHQLIPNQTDNTPPSQQVFITLTGVAVNSNETDGCFEVNAAQYASHYKRNRELFVLPVCAHLNANKLESESLVQVPSENTGVSVAWVLESVETDSNGHAILFHVAVDDVNSFGIIT